MEIIEKAKQEVIKNISDKKIIDIIKLFCVIDERPYPEGTGIWGHDIEIFSTDENMSGKKKAIIEVRKLLEKANKPKEEKDGN